MSSGHSATGGWESFTVTVLPQNELTVSVELGPAVVAGPLTRCITFELWNCTTGQKESIDQELSFTNGQSGMVTLLVPCAAGPFTCITARDRLHTLRQTADAADGHFGIVDTRYVASFTGDPNSGGDWLWGGNLNDSPYVDILDFGVFSWQYGTVYGAGNTTCSTAYPHADVNGDGIVNTADFTFIQINFTRSSATDCCAGPGDPNEPGSPITRISVTELNAVGLGELAAGDLNGDGWLDELDMDLFAHSLPRPGDMNCDGVVSFVDINPFVLALTGRAAYEAQFSQCRWLNADANGDGMVNFADINPFVALLAR